MLARIVILVAIGFLLGYVPAKAESVYTPKPGTAERKAIMDALRAPVMQDLGQRVVFVVEDLKVKDGWAFLFGTPRQPNLKAVDYRKTRYAEDVKEGMFDDNISALLHRESGAWKVKAFIIGATDVPWVPWPEEFGAPREIFRGLQ